MSWPLAPGCASLPAVDLLVLAGGTGERLGGRDKGALVVGGRTLLERALRSDLGGSRVLVGTTPVPPGVDVVATMEDPPGGGPVAGIAAGLAALRAGSAAPSGWVAVVAVDQPGAADALVRLRAALPGAPDATEAVSHADATGRRQWLLAIYRRSALEAALVRLGSVRDSSVRRLVGGLTWHEVADGAEHIGDVNTWDDLSRWREALR